MSTNPRPREERSPERDHATAETGPAPAAPPQAKARRAVWPVLRWIGHHVRGFHAAVGTFMIVGVLLIIGCALLFAELAEDVMEGQTQAFDRAVLEWLNQQATPQLTLLALEVTALGATVVVWMLVLVSSVFLWVSKHRYSVLLLWVSMIGAGLINSTMKTLFNRPRPDVFPWRTEQAVAASFPSGHAMTSMVAYSTLAFLIARLEPSPLLRRMTFAFATVIILLIGLSRLYLGVHWPSDVIGGFITGLAWAAFCAVGFEALRFFRRRHPEVEEQERDLDAEPEREAGLRE